MAKLLKDFPPPPIIRKGGRPPGVGRNLDLLRKLTPGDPNMCIFGVSERKMLSLKGSAWQFGWTIMRRKLADGKYCIWRVK
jgi:hypothetical protein